MVARQKKRGFNRIFLLRHSFASIGEIKSFYLLFNLDKKIKHCLVYKKEEDRRRKQRLK